MQIKNLKKKIFDNGLGEIGSRVPFIISEMLIAKSLGLSQYGIWALIQIVINYNNFSHFGLLSGLAKFEPRLIGKKSSDKLINRIKSNAYYPILVLDIFIILPLLLAYNYFIETVNLTLCICVFLLAFLQQIYLFFQTTLQNSLDFKKLSFAKLIYSFIFLCVVLFLHIIDRIEVLNLIIGWIFSLAVVCANLALSKNLMPTFKIDKKTINILFYFGFPVFLVGISKLSLISVDRYFISIYLNNSSLSIYNISFQFMMMISMLVGLVSRVFSPYYLRTNKNNIPHEFDLYYFKKWVLIYSAFIAFVFVFVFQLFLKYYLTEYSSSYLIGSILIFIGIFQGSMQFTITQYVKNNSELKLFIIFVLANLLYVPSIWAITIIFKDIELIAFFSLIFWVSFEGYFLLKDSGLKSVWLLLLIILLVIYTVFIVLYFNSVTVFIISGAVFFILLLYTKPISLRIK